MHAEQCTYVVLVLSSLLLVCEGVQPKRFRFCGEQLNHVLRIACQNGFNSPNWDANPTIRVTTDPNFNPQRSGVATECCHQMCTWRTILSYCEDDGKKVYSDVDVANLHEQIRSGQYMGMQGQRSGLAAAAPEVAVTTKKHKGRKRRKRRMGRKKRKGRGGRKGDAPNRCERRQRPTRARKIEYEHVKRSAPLFGTVSPEYMRFPRTLDEIPFPYQRMQGGF